MNCKKMVNYQNLKQNLQSFSPNLYCKMKKRKMYIKFAVSGCLTAIFELGLLYILTDLFKVYYLLSSCFSFSSAIIMSFCLQKFWTFNNNGYKKIRQQLFLYCLTNLIGLSFNTMGMFFLVDKFQIMYIFSQIIVGTFVAVFSFLTYKFIIFKST